MKEQVLDILKDGINDIEKVKKQYTTMHTQDVLDALRRLQDRINELTIPVVVGQSELFDNFFDYLVKYGIIHDHAIPTKDKIIERAQEIIK